MTRPRVICHMMTSVDGRIVTDGWPLSDDGRRQYEQLHATFEPDAWMCGRVTMEQHFAARARSDAEVARTHDGPARDDFVAPGEHDSFAIALDPSGKLGEHGVVPTRLTLEHVERRADDVLWLRYRVETS
jgi:2,5-diamino-6-(ribosylamino)-4(3H)-pyrimidinone 5'-phosphate reductase